MRAWLALAVLVPVGIAAQERGQAKGPEEAARLHVVPATVPISLDARLDGPAWAHADSITDFRQREPSAGAPASERTVVKVLRDAEALYIAVRCYDSDARGVRASQLRRDADLSSDDNVQLLIDSFDDRRSAFLFGTNPNGAMWDAQFSGVDDLNESWNGVWDVAVSRDAAGWTAEFRIPFRALRFHTGTNTEFGFNVRRFIRRKNEEDLWRSYGRPQGLYHLNNEGRITDLGDLRRPHDVELYPYALGRAVEAERDSVGGETAGGYVGGKGGVDAKVGLTPTVTADVTVSTDFAQVEADQQVINLTRFPFFFPEKRQFFLESSGLLDYGTPGMVQLFYSRRLGLDTSGAPVPILAGGRVYGRLGPWQLGILDAQTGGSDRANDAVLRVTHDLFDRSFVGAIGTLHASPGGQGVARAGGLDVDLPLVLHGMNLEPKVYLAGSQTPGVPGTAIAWRISTDNPNDLFDNFVSFYRIDAAFAPPLGFVRRTGIWEAKGHTDFMPRPHALGVRQLDFKLIPEWDIIANESGSPLRSRNWQTAWLEWRFLGGDRENGDRFEFNVQRFLDAPTDTFDIFRQVKIPPGRYWWSRYELQYFMSAGRPLAFGAFVNWGALYGGRSADVELQGAWRGGGHVIVSGALSRTAARLPAGGFTALLASSRIEYDFNTRTSFLGFVQYNNDAQRADFNLRFHWIPQIGDDVFVVWNSGYTTNGAATYRFPAARSLTRPLNGAFVLKIVHRIAP